MCACAIAHAMPSGSGCPRSAMSTFLPLAAASASANGASSAMRWRRQTATGASSGRVVDTGSLMGNQANCGACFGSQVEGHRSGSATEERSRRAPRDGAVLASPPSCALDGSLAHASRRAVRRVRSPPRSSRCRRSLWVADATSERASLHGARARPGDLPVHRLGCLAGGERDYRDVRDVNGPLTHIVHLVFLALGGARRAPLPRARPRRDGRDVRRRRARVSRGHALAGAVTARRAGGLGARGVGRAQRAVPALHLLGPRAARELLRLVPASERGPAARRAGADAAARRRRARAAAAARRRRARSASIACFGKPTLRALHDRAALHARSSTTRRARPRARAARHVRARVAARGRSSQLSYLLVFGDLGAFLRDRRSSTCRRCTASSGRATSAEILALPGNAPTIGYALVTSAIVVGLDRSTARCPGARSRSALTPRLRRRQRSSRRRRDFPYHFHPVTAGLSFQWLLLVAWLAERCRVAAAEEPRTPRARSPPPPSLALRIATTLSKLSAHRSGLWILGEGHDPRGPRERASTLVYFQTADFFPWEMRQAAAYLREHTAPDRSRQAYGMDPYVLFLAERTERDAVHLRLRPQRRRRARRGHAPRGYPPERPRASADPRHPRRARGRLLRAAPARPAGGVRLHRPVAAHHLARRLGGLPEPRSGGGRLGQGALPANGGVRSESRLAAERSAPRELPRQTRNRWTYPRFQGRSSRAASTGRRHDVT